MTDLDPFAAPAAVLEQDGSPLRNTSSHAPPCRRHTDSLPEKKRSSR